jgi:Tol biopolymer transport system component
VPIRQVSNGLITFHAKNQNGNIDIYVMQPDGSELQRLTKSTEDDTSPVWSPNGAYILYRHGDNIYRMNADGSNPQLLSDRTRNPFYAWVNNLSWSPDGTKIAFSMDHYICNEEERVVYSALVVIDVSSGHTHCALSFPMTTGTQKPTAILNPIWSPDGQRFAFRLSVDNIGEIYVMNVDGTDLRRVENDKPQKMGIQWLPDGNHLIFSMTEKIYGSSDGLAFYTINTDGSDLQRALSLPDWIGDIRWERGWYTSVEGHLALVSLQKKDLSSTYMALIDTRTLMPVYIREMTLPLYWSMSPDTQKLLYQGSDGSYITNRDGTERLTLSTPLLEIQNPSWQPVWK